MSYDAIYNLAERLDSFAQDFDFYNYMDNLSGADSIEELTEALQDPQQVKGIIDFLEENLGYMDELDENYDTITELLEDLSELELEGLSSLENKLLGAEKRKSAYVYDASDYEAEMELY